jgi:pimeloyl-ACP methyl ester carboxylesterase
MQVWESVRGRKIAKNLNGEGTKMSMASRRGVDLYYETKGSGPAVLMLHGFFGSSQDWEEYGYVAAFSTNFRVIVTDFRGHGKSGKPLEPEAYRVSEYARDVHQILEVNGVKEFHLIGFSNGARVGFALSAMEDIRMLSFVCIGRHPFAEDMSPIRDGVNRLDTWPKECPISIDHQKRLLANDKAALRAAAALDRPAEAIDRTTMPTLVIAGRLDEDYESIAKTTSLLPNAQLLTLEGLNHVETLTKSDRVLPRVLAFISAQL